jgi:hypothetical protein
MKPAIVIPEIAPAEIPPPDPEELFGLLDSVLPVTLPEGVGLLPDLGEGEAEALAVCVCDMSAARSKVYELAAGWAELRDEKVLLSARLLTLARGSWAVVQQVFMLPTTRVQISLRRCQQRCSPESVLTVAHMSFIQHHE